MMRSLLAAALLLAGTAASAACPPLLDMNLPTLTEDAASLCRFEGKVLLVVNTASQCGYTPQYEGLGIYRRYKDKGLVVVGFPSNDFGGQEPGSNQEIAQFCEINYGVSFPMFAKSAITRKAPSIPFYERLARASNSRPRWNFHKYLVDRTGEKVLAYDTKVDPNDPRLVKEFERLLAERGG